MAFVDEERKLELRESFLREIEIQTTPEASNERLLWMLDQFAEYVDRLLGFAHADAKSLPSMVEGSFGEMVFIASDIINEEVANEVFPVLVQNQWKVVISSVNMLRHNFDFSAAGDIPNQVNIMKEQLLRAAQKS